MLLILSKYLASREGVSIEKYIIILVALSTNA